MDRPPRPIWKLLIVFSEPEQDGELTCDECFNIMEYLAGEAVRGIDMKILREAVHHHFEYCAGCHEHHLQRLEELEAVLNDRE